jgi:hypothetical protein
MWKFHVVLEHKGYIYDFDFKKSPEILKSRDYFFNMFYLSETLNPKYFLYMRVIPAQDYLENYRPGPKSSQGNFIDYIHGQVGDKTYPLVELRDFLE